MKTTQKQSEALLREAVLERPIGISINDKHYCLYPPSLGKTLLIAPIMQSLCIDEGLLQPLCWHTPASPQRPALVPTKNVEETRI